MTHVVGATVVCSGEELRDLRQRTEAVRLQVEAAEAAEAALLERLKGELGEAILDIMVSTIKERYMNNPAATDKPAGTMQLALYNAMIAVPAAVAAHKKLQEELSEAEKVWKHPWRAVCRVEQQCDALWALVVPMAEALGVVAAEAEGPEEGGEWKEGEEGGRTKAPRSLEAVLADPVWTQALQGLPSLPLARGDKEAVSEAMTKELAALQRDMEVKEGRAKAAAEAYEALQGEVSGQLEDEGLFEGFMAAAAEESGASDARPRVRDLYEARKAVEETKSAVAAARKALEERTSYLGSVAWVLERLSTSVEGLMTVYPATLSRLVQELRGKQ